MLSWALAIGLAILLLAIIIQRSLAEMMEDENEFLWIVGAFFVLYIAAAIGVSFLMPPISSLGGS